MHVLSTVRVLLR